MLQDDSNFISNLCKQPLVVECLPSEIGGLVHAKSILVYCISFSSKILWFDIRLVTGNEFCFATNRHYKVGSAFQQKKKKITPPLTNLWKL